MPKLTRKQAARKLAALVKKHLDSLPPAEREEKLRRFLALDRKPS